MAHCHVCAALRACKRDWKPSQWKSIWATFDSRTGFATGSPIVEGFDRCKPCGEDQRQPFFTPPFPRQLGYLALPEVKDQISALRSEIPSRFWDQVAVRFSKHHRKVMSHWGAAMIVFNAERCIRLSSGGMSLRGEWLDVPDALGISNEANNYVFMDPGNFVYQHALRTIWPDASLHSWMTSSGKASDLVEAVFGRVIKAWNADVMPTTEQCNLTWRLSHVLCAAFLAAKPGHLL